MGLSLSDAFRLLLKRGAAERALPFDPLVPNADTVAAIREARRGRFKKDYRREKSGRHGSKLDVLLTDVLAMLAADAPCPAAASTILLRGTGAIIATAISAPI